MTNKYIKLLAVALVGIALLSAIIYVSISNKPQGTSNSVQYVPRELLKLYVLSSLYLDRASSSLYHTIYDLPLSTNITMDNIDQLLSRYKQDEKYLPLVPVTGIDRYLVGTYETYREIAFIARDIIIINNSVSEIMPKMKKTLRSLVNCNYTEAMRDYQEIRDKAIRLEENISNILLNLTSINTSYILSPKHVQVINRTIALLRQLDEILNKYITIMDEIQKNPIILQKACMITSGKHPGIDKQLIEQAQELVNQMSNSQLGGLDPEKDALVALISNILSQNSNGGQGQSSGNASGNGEGGGAGSYNYTETD